MFRPYASLHTFAVGDKSRAPAWNIPFLICIYSETLLIRHTKGSGKCFKLYRISGFILVNINTLGPKYLSDFIGFQKTQVSDCTSSTVVFIYSLTCSRSENSWNTAPWTLLNNQSILVLILVYVQELYKHLYWSHSLLLIQTQRKVEKIAERRR
jgi:hypothetical protein